MEMFGGIISGLPSLVERNDDDVYDRISHRWTAAIFALCTIIVSTSSFVGDPIHCWVPAHFTGAWEKYVDSFCWVRNTYYLPFPDEIPKDHDERRKIPIIYYQWVPLILMVQGLFFYIPIVFWRNLNSSTGIDVNDIVETAEKVEQAEDLEVRKKLLRLLTNQMNRSLQILKEPYKYAPDSRFNIKLALQRCCKFCGQRRGNFMSCMYFIIKLLFLANAVGQLWLTNAFLGPWEYQYYGFHVIQAMYRGEDWTESPRFPRVTMCDFTVRRLGNLHTYSSQCVLTINLFNEKIYLFLWFWMVLVAFITAFGLIMWFCRTFLFRDEVNYVYKYLSVPKHLFNPKHKADRQMLKYFVEEFLHADGLLVIRLVDYNTDKVTMSDLLSAIYESWVTRPKIQKRREDIHASTKEPIDDDEEPLIAYS